MYKKVSLILFILVLGALIFITLPLVSNDINKIQVEPSAPPAPDRVGEEIIYEVRLKGVYFGEARFKYQGKAQLNGRSLNLFLFDTKVVNFSDKEIIYAEPKTLLPVRIERTIRGFFKNEQIIEDYDQENYQVRLTKKAGKRSEQIVLKKQGVIQNAILFPFAIRDLPELKVGRVFQINLPGRSLEVKLVSIEKLKLRSGDIETFHFESTPQRQVAFWISTDSRRIPVKIEGAGAFGYILTMKDYHLE